MATTGVNNEEQTAVSGQPQQQQPQPILQLQPQQTPRLVSVPTQPTAAQATQPQAYTIPKEYKQSSYDAIVSQLGSHMQRFKPLSEEELKKLRKRQKAEGVISSISDAARALTNLVYTSKYAPNMYDHTTSMSEKTKARFDKEKAERDANDDRYFNYALTIANLKDKDKQQGLKIWELEQAAKNRADDVDYRERVRNDNNNRWDRNFRRQGDWHNDEVNRWQQQFDENVRNNNRNYNLHQQSVGMQRQQLNHNLAKDTYTISLGGDRYVTIPPSHNNISNISYIFEQLPSDIQNSYSTLVNTTDNLGNQIQTFVRPTDPARMLAAIGAYLGTPDGQGENGNTIRNELYEIAGQGNYPTSLK